jgi:hypothetical protein
MKTLLCVLSLCLSVVCPTSVYAQGPVPENVTTFTRDINTLIIGSQTPPNATRLTWLNHHALITAPVVLNNTATINYARATQLMGDKAPSAIGWTNVHCNWVASQTTVDRVALNEGMSLDQLIALQEVGLAGVKHDMAYGVLVRNFLIDADNYRKQGVGATDLLNRVIEKCQKSPTDFGMELDKEGFENTPTTP